MMSGISVLKPQIVICIVGASNIDDKKQVLANMLSQSDFDCPVEVRISNRFATKSKKRPIDFIVYATDEQTKSSNDEIEDLLSETDVRYFMGRSCLVAFTSKCVYSDDTGFAEALLEIAEKYQLQILHANAQDEKEMRILCARVAKLAAAASGLRPGITPSLLTATLPSRKISKDVTS